MMDITVTVSTASETLWLGRRGETNVRRIIFDLNYFIDNYGDGTATLLHRRHDDEEPYLVSNVTQEDDVLTWVITDTDTTYVGIGQCEIRWTVEDGLAKSVIYNTKVLRSMADGEEVPEAYESWYDAMIEYIDAHGLTVDTAMSDSSVNAVRNSVIKAYVDESVPDVTEIEADIDGLTAELETLSDDHETVKNEVTVLASQVSQLNTDVASLNTDLLSAESDIVTLQNTTSELADDVVALNSAQTALSERMDTVESDVAELQTTVVGKQDAITVGSVTLSAIWTGSPFSQTVTIPDVTANSKIDLQPTVNTLNQMTEDGTTALWAENNNGTVTVYAMGNAPSVSMAVQYSKSEVSS